MMPGVDRDLDRDGDEVARATSVVRFAAGSRFPRHEHALGEELLVLRGRVRTSGPATPPALGVRNPPGSACAIERDGMRSVRQVTAVPPEDRERVVVDCRRLSGFPGR